MTANPRDDRILDHVGLYRMSLRRVLERTFFEDRTCANVVERLVDAKRLVARDGLPGRLVHDQLTRAEAERRGVPESRARPLRSQALHNALATLWFCCMGNLPRHRLEQHQIDDLFGEAAPRGAHCIERVDDETHRVHSLRVTSPDAEDEGVLRWLRASVDELARRPTIREWLTTGRYAFVVLTETEGRIESLRRAIANDRRLTGAATIEVGFAPGHDTIASAVRASSQSTGESSR